MLISERGTVLLLMPAAVFIVLLLGAIVVDVGLSRVRGQELATVASAAANDALGALDQGAFRTDGSIVIDVAAARSAVSETIARSPLPDASIDSLCVPPDSACPDVIVVTLSIDVDLVLTSAIPGAPESIHVTTAGRAQLIDT